MRVPVRRLHLPGPRTAIRRDDRAALFGADLSGAVLTGADLTEADLTHANLTGALWPTNAAVPAGWQRDTHSGRLKRAQ